MKNEQKQIEEFMKAARQELPLTPTIPSHEVVALRIDLMLEEMTELITAMHAKNLVETADGIGDLLYVVIGTASACGIDIEPVFHEIHRSNMTKFIDGTFREDGKYVKGPSYSKADIESILLEQHNQTKIPAVRLAANAPVCKCCGSKVSVRGLCDCKTVLD